MAKKRQATSARRKQAIIRTLIMCLIVVCVNVLASYFHTGIDLTREGRFTLTAPTKKLLKNMKEVAFIDVYLSGKALPAELQRMQEAVRERLTSFKAIAGTKIIFRFVDPIAGKSDEEQKQIVKDLAQKGIHFIKLPTKEEEGYSVKICFPYALMQYNGRELPIELLENPPGKTRQEQTSYAEALLEYKFAGALQQLSKADKPKILYIYGHNEDISRRSADMLNTLGFFYNLDSMNLAHSLHISNAYEAIIINQPNIPFTQPEKLKLDQYVMRGGHILWILNTMNANMDSLINNQKFMAAELGLNLDDLLFKYGVRINNDLVEDKSCMPLPHVNNGQRELLPWVYFPRINPIGQHPIVKNMDFIMGGFSSSIDTINTPGIRQEILLESSKYSRTAGSPVTVSLTKLAYPGPNENFNKPYRPLAVLLEGKFHSVYENHLAPSYLKLLDSLHEPYKHQCDTSTSMIVTSVGDIFTNDYTQADGALPLGYNRFTKDFYANKIFLLNCMEYLTDKSGILEARSKDVKLRLLDLGRVKEENAQWQWINVGVPIAIVLIFASFYTFLRKRKYETKKK